MKKFSSFLFIAMTFMCCSKETDLTEIEQKLEELGNKDKDIQEQIDDLKKKEPEDPVLISMTFMAKDNPQLLTANVEGKIIGDSIVDCWVPNFMTSKSLVAQMRFTGENVKFNGTVAQSGSTKFDFSKPVKLTVTNVNKVKDYNVYVHAYTGIPVIWIETDGRKEIVSRDEYVGASFKMYEDVRTRAPGDLIESRISIKGRGNSNWAMPKKPYRLKFDQKVSLLGEHQDKAWVLLGNYADKTMLRNSVAFFLSEMSNLDYTPKAHFVEVMLNGAYNGTYQLCEKLKTADHRVNVGADGFLLEVDAHAKDDEVVFNTEHLVRPINIKSPNVVVGDENYNYIKDYITNLEKALFSDNFKDPDEGWQKYMDMDSFVDWYLINEIAKCNDAIFYTSCYMNLTRGGKLKMGPIWDYDTAFGNINYNDNFTTDGLWVSKATWYAQLLKDPAFVSRVKERFDYFYSRKNDILQEINENAIYLEHAVQENENRWHTFNVYTWPNYNFWGCYNNEVQSLKDWLSARFEWLKIQY